MAEEVEMEVEAVEAVYGPDCTVLCAFPPHLSILLKPRTADVLTIQFVEAKLIIKASVEYPNKPPELDLKDAKGLGDTRHAKLLETVEAQAKEMSGEPMLVAICEAATDLLTEMNVPDGECCFCMNPFLMEDGAQPFMKLMSCFHCFHSDCFGNWWRWLQQQHKGSSSGGVSAPMLDGSDNDERSEKGTVAEVEDFPVNCPVCRMVVNAEDVAHVLEFLIAERSVDRQREEDAKVPDSVLTSEELERRARFTAEFEAQQSRGAIIEPKKLEVILPGMIVPPRTPVEGQPPTLAPGSAAESPSGDQIPPTSPVESPGTSSSVSGISSSGTERGSLKANTHEENARAGRGVFRGRRGGGNRGASHTGSRNHHGRARGTKDYKQATNGPPRQSYSSSHQSLGIRKGGNARRGVEVDDM
ncbi:hypothetical protein R1flu_011635 [Riccia fluitans]|uniref:RWD domain-containing protein n=1 Tax=Riccia fluitans TaxID=41844 RepID=A0ABD1Z8K6_9MARC